MKAFFLSNTTVDPVIKKAAPMFSEVRSQHGFDTWRETLAAGSFAGTDIVFVIIDGFALHEKCRNVPVGTFAAECFALLRQAAEANPHTVFCVSDIDVPDHEIIAGNAVSSAAELEDIWNDSLSALRLSLRNVKVLELRQQILDAGRSQFYSMKLWYLGGIRYSAAGQKALFERIERTRSAHLGLRRKCLVLDADNTLWGGVIGEDGPEGITLAPSGEGARYYDFQRAVAQIASTGILCAIVSKNNPDDLRQGLSHPHMLLREDFFVSVRASWNSKADEIAALARQLNLGLDSFVFIDDSPSERELIKNMLPDVAVPGFPADTAELPLFAYELYDRFFRTHEFTADDAARNALYKTEALRAQEHSAAPDLEQFLRGLNMRVTASAVGETDLPRFVQLCQKTNQFNLTTKRYSEADAARMLSDGSFSLYIFSAEDRFGSCGHIGAAVLVKENDLIRIDTFLLSCRAMGRNIEYGILGWLIGECVKRGVSRVRGDFVRSAKNAAAEDFLSRAGFTACGDHFIAQLPVNPSAEFCGEVAER